jgi:hypothetical protein
VTGWALAYWMLMTAFIMTAALNLLHVRGGFLTSHLADLTVPALLYVISRGLVPARRPPLPSRRLMQWIGRTPERAASVFFVASAVSEVSQIYWPRGVFAGRFDPWDLLAYAVGLSVCYTCDRLQSPKGQRVDAS